MTKIEKVFVIICQFMHESGIFSLAVSAVDCSSGYVMPELLAETSSSLLYRVRKAGKYFIIKTVKDDSGQSLALLQREYELSLGKSHPNIVNIFTFEQSTVVGPGIVMEYVDGRTLADYIAENPSFASRMRVFEQLLQAVSYIHRCGLVHNDIKPENIIITRSDDDVKLIDFGLADSDAYYLLRTLGCTRAYASPELLARETSVDSRSDIYSLGVIMKELFGNRCSHISVRCLRQDRGKRYRNADELLSAIKHRHRPLFVALSIAVAVIISLPLLYIGNMVLFENDKIHKEKELLLQVEQDVHALYSLTADSLSHAVYLEFAVNNILNFFDTLAVYNREYISTLSPPDLYIKVSDHYTAQVNECNERLWAVAKKLPPYYRCGLNQEELLFYKNLIEKRMPYTPYKK